MKTVYFYEGPYQFSSVKTEQPVTGEYLRLTLNEQYNYRPTTETLWCTVLDAEGKEIERYQFNPSTRELVKITFPAR